MFVKTLRLKNVRSHVNSEFELDRIPIIRGQNGSGKTTILHGLQLALTGKAEPLTDAKGAGAEKLIRLGEKALEIEVEFLQRGALGLIRYTRNAAASSWFVGSASGK